MAERKDTGTDDSRKPATKVSSDNQYEMTDATTPLYEASEELVKARARVGRAKDDLVKAEEKWIEEMKRIRKSVINHKGDIIEYVKGRTTEDHARFKKS